MKSMKSMKGMKIMREFGVVFHVFHFLLSFFPVFEFSTLAIVHLSRMLLDSLVSQRLYRIQP